MKEICFGKFVELKKRQTNKQKNKKKRKKYYKSHLWRIEPPHFGPCLMDC